MSVGAPDREEFGSRTRPLPSEQAGHRLVGSVATRLVRTGRWPVVVVP
ncbi:hypothetical protein [Micromonospora profundi]